MKVILAGFNVDTERLFEYKKGALKLKDLSQKRENQNDEIVEFLNELGTSEELTPETFSAAYARISRDPRPVNELRRVAVEEVETARKLNESIIFGMGHASVAEHAVFNLDIIGISRLVTEELQRTRLASYTEKSQRYITLTDDHVIPKEIIDAGLESPFKDAVVQLNQTYHKLYNGLLPLMDKKHPDLAKDKKGKVILDGWAKEDARYIVPLATQTQMGMTTNARTLEMTIRRLSVSKLMEARELAKSIYDAAFPHAPSLIKYAKGTDYDTKTDGLIKESFLTHTPNKTTVDEIDNFSLKLIDHTKDGDIRLATALIFPNTNLDYASVFDTVKGMSQDNLKKTIESSFKYMESYDRALREFEMVNLTFEAVMSSSCFAQLKRHRMATIISQDYDIDLGVEIPGTILEANLQDDFTKAIAISETMYDKIKSTLPQSAPYILANAHRLRVLISFNLRELYHIARIRIDKTAQWDIRNLSSAMVKIAKEVFPIGTALACSKDTFSETKENLNLNK
jgi:flavin-dependent thymidylate synthase